MKRVLTKLVPEAVKRHVRRRRTEKRKRELFGDLAPMVPDVDRMFDGPPTLEEFRKNGDEFIRIYKEVCGLRPDEKMLDVGSGIGRKTLPLLGYLDARGSYTGIEITKAGVDWCRERISARHPNFRFEHIDVYNKHYNPGGRCQPSEYRFPFDDGAFTFVMLGSVFTHMLPPDLENYLSEICRVTAKGGRCLITYFLLNGESLPLVLAGKSSQDLKYVGPGYRTISTVYPELSIGFPEEWVRGLYAKFGMTVERLDYGSWCGREKFTSYQDLVLARKS